MSLAFRVSGEDKAVEHITSGMFVEQFHWEFRMFGEYKAVKHIISAKFVEPCHCFL